MALRPRLVIGRPAARRLGRGGIGGKGNVPAIGRKGLQLDDEVEVRREVGGEHELDDEGTDGAVILRGESQLGLSQ